MIPCNFLKEKPKKEILQFRPVEMSRAGRVTVTRNGRGRRGGKGAGY